MRQVTHTHCPPRMWRRKAPHRASGTVCIHLIHRSALSLCFFHCTLSPPPSPPVSSSLTFLPPFSLALEVDAHRLYVYVARSIALIVSCFTSKGRMTKDTNKSATFSLHLTLDTAFYSRLLCISLSLPLLIHTWPHSPPDEGDSSLTPSDATLSL